jgi:hypothetical protein
MARLPGIHTTAIPTTRGDGTVHFKYPVTASERVCQWGLASLWVIAPLLAIAILW